MEGAPDRLARLWSGGMGAVLAAPTGSQQPMSSDCSHSKGFGFTVARARRCSTVRDGLCMGVEPREQLRIETLRRLSVWIVASLLHQDVRDMMEASD